MAENAADRVTREDITIFLNACFAATGQAEFDESAAAQKVSLDFLHDYIRGNYRRLYALCLAAGVNHDARRRIIVGLLTDGRGVDDEHRDEEGTLIAHALRSLPPHRAWKTLSELRTRGITNRRSRAVAREFLATRPISFDAVKYAATLRAVAAHHHLKLPTEIARFLFGDWSAPFTDPLLDAARRARHSADAIYELPFTVAEGYAAKHGVPRERFLEKIAPRLTEHERLRLQQSSRRAGAQIAIDLSRASLTRLALYALSLPFSERMSRRDELDDALRVAARRTLAQAPISLPRTASVLDISYSSSGSREKRRRPLGVAVASHYLLAAAAREYRAFWTAPIEHPLCARPRGATDLATSLLDALEWKAETIVIVSDGVENDPPDGIESILRWLANRGDPTRIVHLNPVFRAADYAPRGLSMHAPTIGLRDAEDLPTALGFAAFAAGAASRGTLEAYLRARADHWLGAAAMETAPDESAHDESMLEANG